MRAGRIRSASIGAALALALTGCGSSGSDTPQPAQGADPTDGASASAQPSVDMEEQITPGGIAAIVNDHFGSDAVRRFVTFEPESGRVSVSVRLRDDAPHHFIVSVYSPKQVEHFGEGAGQCPSEPEGQDESQCRTLEDGTTVITTEHAEAFSDGNEDGAFISGRSVTPDDGAALAMYESSDDSPAVSTSDLDALLSDPRLTWLTDPSVNEAGQDIDVRFMD